MRGNGADGISDIEGKATGIGASQRGQRTSFNKQCRHKPWIRSWKIFAVWAACNGDRWMGPRSGVVAAVSAAEPCSQKSGKISEQNSTSAHSALVFIGCLGGCAALADRIQIGYHDVVTAESAEHRPLICWFRLLGETDFEFLRDLTRIISRL